jgi:hypothetical protein
MLPNLRLSLCGSPITSDIASERYPLWQLQTMMSRLTPLTCSKQQDGAESIIAIKRHATTASTLMAFSISPKSVSDRNRFRALMMFALGGDAG